MRIVFVRHGEPNYEKDCLTPKGHLQAQAAAKRLREEGITRIYSSPMGRARQTAEKTAQELGIPDIQILDFMHELSWGSADGEPTAFDGHPWDIADELMRRGEDLTSPDWRMHAFYRNNRVVQGMDYVAEEIDKWIATLGYEREGLYYRCKRPNDEQLTVALFSHGGSSSAALAQIFHQQFPYACACLHMPFTGITIARFDRRPGSLGMPCLELTGDGRHIAGV